MLSPGQIAEFEATGVLVVPDVLPPKVLDAVRAEYRGLMDELYADWHAQGLVPSPDGMDFWQKLQVSYDAGLDWFQPMDISLPGDQIRRDTPFHIGPAVFDMMTCPSLLDVVECLIGPEITSNPIQHVRLKPPARKAFADERRAHLVQTAWHQDQGVTHEDADGTKMITVWLAIEDTDEQNGCLQVIPGKPQMYPHCPKRQTCIADGFLDLDKARALPVKAGGAVIFHPLTPHASLDNNSDRFRWSFDIRFNVTGQPTGRAHFPDFVARSRAHPETELKDWRQSRAMWEDARTACAGAAHIPIHRWAPGAPVCA